MTRTCRLCGCTDNQACVVDGVPCHWVGLALCSACVSRTLDGVTQDTAGIERLGAAWSSFNTAPIGRLNVTRDELEAVAGTLGWSRSSPLLAWVRATLINAGGSERERG